MTRRRDLTALATAVAACAAVLLAPAVARSSVPPADPGTLAGAWPQARPFDIPGRVLSGESYQPQAFVTAGVSVGTATSGDGTTVTLVEVDSGLGHPVRVRALQAGLATAATYDAFAITGTDVYVMRGATDTAGDDRESLWRIPVSTWSPVLLVADAGAVQVQGSVNDLQIAAGTLRWMATSTRDPSLTDLHTIPLGGGPQRVVTLNDTYTLTTYPWLYSGEMTDPPHPKLTDSLTGMVTAVQSAVEAGADCDPAWCVMQTSDDTGANAVQLCKPDGTGLTRLGDGNTSLVTPDPTLLDRFVLLSEQTAAMADTASPYAQLFLYDLRTRRSITVTPAATGSFGAGRWLWWSTGAHASLTWHALDLNTLTS